jgi:hypothetical protein
MTGQNVRPGITRDWIGTFPNPLSPAIVGQRSTPNMRILPLRYAGQTGSDVSLDDSVSLGTSK